MTIIYDNHQYADIFPMMSDEQFAELKDDIQTNGQITPIILFDGKILDGRNRYKACNKLNEERLEAGIETVDPIFAEYTGNNAAGYVLAINELRRDMNVDQKSIVCAHFYQTVLVDLLNERVSNLPDFEKLNRMFGVGRDRTLLAIKIIESCGLLSKHSEDAGSLWLRVRDGESTLNEAENGCRTYAKTYKVYTSVFDGSKEAKKAAETTEEEKIRKARESAYRALKKHLKSAVNSVGQAKDVSKKDLETDDRIKAKTLVDGLITTLIEIQGNLK